MDANFSRMADIGMVCRCGANLPVLGREYPFPGIYFCLRCRDWTFLKLAGFEDGSSSGDSGEKTEEREPGEEEF